jgi:Fe-S cluster biosynthesis and repair protein YggX
MHKLSREASILNLKLFLGYGFKIFAHLSQYSWSEYILFQINLISNFKSITNNIDMLKVVIVALLLTLALTFSITFGKQ